jgi:hypothetical protein
MSMSVRIVLVAVCAATAAAGCSSSPQPPEQGTTYLDPGAPVGELSLSSADGTELAALEQQLAPLERLTASELVDGRKLTYGPALGYEPTTAANLALIQASTLALNAKELEKLGQQGFVIAPRHAFPNMAYAYKTIYALDLPVFVSLDAILETVHLSYDAILKELELSYLTGELQTLLTEARARLQSGVVTNARTARDLDVYLTVALSLLRDRPAQPASGADAAEIAKIVSAAREASGIIGIELFGARRELDFSQFEPRGHYEDLPELQRYFRASMWLGRTDLRLIETLPDGSQVFRRRQLEAVLALRALVEGPARVAFDHIDQVISAWVGEHDYMQLREVDALIADLGGTQLDGWSDQQLAQTIIEKGYGAQRIASQVIFKSPAAAQQTLPLDRSFALLGQRYTADSHVFSNVVYDRVLVPDTPWRLLPNPLDAAYAAIANDAALPLLQPELEQYRYAPDLARMRTLIDAHGEDYWSANLYNLWLSSLRAMSPGPELADPATRGLPLVAGSDAWQRRLLNTQLASWAELRHDTILYVKQSYTSGDACEFPDGYVDPYPQAFERLRLYALKGQEATALLPAGAAQSFSWRVKTHFQELALVATTLREMAEHQRSGEPFTAEQLAFLNDAVRSQSIGCGGPESYQGWYGRLLFDKTEEEMDPTIADVHTDPGGDRPPQVLHVATGLPRLMIVTANTCEGARAYAGVVSSYHEVITGLDRLTDSEWAPKAAGAEDVAWMKPILP